MSHRPFVLSILLFVLLSAGPVLPAAAGAPRQLPCSKETTATTKSGPVCGLTIDNVVHYLGIPYAAPPIVTDESHCEDTTPSSLCLRWKPPQDPAPWTDPLPATAFGSECPQPDAGNNPTGNEDCLYLNVYRPTDAKQRPVMVFIHGGAFFEGSASTELFDGAQLATQGNLVVVDFNYRLGALGFMVAADAQPKNSLTGNYGFLDQQKALAWVSDNIKSFGGDHKQVTIFGQSAGAMSVGLHLVAAPASNGYFSAGIMESNPLGIPFQTPAAAQTTGDSLAGSLGCANNIDCLYKIEDAATIIEAQVNVAPPSSGLTWAPVIDGAIVQFADPTQQLEAYSGLGKPLMFGTNHDEGTFFVYLERATKIPWYGYNTALKKVFGDNDQLVGDIHKQYECPYPDDCRVQLAQVLTDYTFTCANRYAANQVPATNKIYAYQFNAVSGFQWPVTSGCGSGNCPCATKVCHSAELPYVFATPDQIAACGQNGNTACSFNPGQGALGTALQDYWTSFATSLAPTGSQTWPAFSSYQLFDASTTADQITTGADPFNDICCFWEKQGLYGTPSAGCTSPPKAKKGKW